MVVVYGPYWWSLGGRHHDTQTMNHISQKTNNNCSWRLTCKGDDKVQANEPVRKSVVGLGVKGRNADIKPSR